MITCGQPARYPKLTASKIVLVMRLIEGEMVDHFDISHAAGLHVNQVAALLAEQIDLENPVRCLKCCALLASIPCVTCTIRKQYPRYAPAISIPICSDRD